MQTLDEVDEEVKLAELAFDEDPRNEVKQRKLLQTWINHEAKLGQEQMSRYQLLRQYENGWLENSIRDFVLRATAAFEHYVTNNSLLSLYCEGTVRWSGNARFAEKTMGNAVVFFLEPHSPILKGIGKGRRAMSEIQIAAQETLEQGLNAMNTRGGLHGSSLWQATAVKPRKDFYPWPMNLGINLFPVNTDDSSFSVILGHALDTEFLSNIVRAA